VSFDPRRALVGLAVAGALIVTPPVASYAFGTVNPGLATHSHVATDPFAERKHHNDNAAHVNDNDDGVNDNATASNDGDYPGKPTPTPSTDSGDDPYYQYHNDPNNN
jgi:hypothetical protein